MLYILPDSAGDMLVVQASETLSAEDLTERLVPAVEKQLNAAHKLRLVLYFDHSLQAIEEQYWQGEALLAAIPREVEGIAVVGSDQWRTWQQQLPQPSAFFSESQFLQALYWVDDL